MTIGQRIKDRRKQLKLSVDELAKKLGKDRSTIYRYEKGDIENLPLDILEPIAIALDTTPQFLMGWDQVQKKNDIIADIVLRMQTDSKFREACEKLYSVNDAKLSSILTLLD